MAYLAEPAAVDHEFEVRPKRCEATHSRAAVAAQMRRSAMYPSCGVQASCARPGTFASRTHLRIVSVRAMRIAVQCTALAMPRAALVVRFATSCHSPALARCIIMSTTASQCQLLRNTLPLCNAHRSTRNERAGS